SAAKAPRGVKAQAADLETMAKVGWKPLASYPDREPAHEALLLKEHFVELLRTDAVKKQAPGFVELMQQAKKLASELEQALLDPRPNAAVRTSAYEKVTANCKSCHERFRDLPLGEKQAR